MRIPTKGVLAPTFLLALAACGGGEPDSAGSARQAPTVYLDDGRVVNSCSIDPRCASHDLVINGSYRQASIRRTADGSVITTPVTTLNAPSSIKRLHFSDGVVALDLDGNAGQAYRLYQAAFNRKPDLPGLGYWIQRMDSGAVPTINDVAHHFYHSDEFRQIYGSAPSYPDLVTRYYRNALQREPDAGGFAFWLDILNRRVLTPSQVLAAFSESPENKSRVINDITNGILFIPYGTGPAPAPVPPPFPGITATAPLGGATIGGVTRLEVRGQDMVNVELLPAAGYTPRMGVFNVSVDRSYAWLDLNTAALPDGPIEVRISVFNVPAGQPGAVEIVAMPARRWQIRNGVASPVPTPPVVTPPVVTPPVVVPPAPIARHTIDQPDEVQGAQFHVLYVRPLDWADQAYDTTLRPRLINSLNTMNDWFARETNGRRIRFDQFNNEIEVTYVQLPFNDAELNTYRDGTFVDSTGNWKRDRIEQELKSRNLLNPAKKYLMIYDGFHPYQGRCGDSTSWDTKYPQVTALYLHTQCFDGDNKPPVTKNNVANWNNFEMVLAHEIVHGLGAATPRAPDFASGGHVSIYGDILYVGSIDKYQTLRLDPSRRNYYNPNGTLPNGLFNLHDSPFLTPGAQ